MAEDEFESMEMEELRRAQEEMLRELEESNWQEELNDQMRELQEQMEMIPDMQQYIQEMESKLQHELKHLQQFEQELNNMLIEDGYISQGEEVSIEFTEDDVKINNQSIKKKDQNKYMDLRKKYFPRDEGEFKYRVN